MTKYVSLILSLFKIMKEESALPLVQFNSSIDCVEASNSIAGSRVANDRKILELSLGNNTNNFMCTGYMRKHEICIKIANHEVFSCSNDSKRIILEIEKKKDQDSVRC